MTEWAALSPQQRAQARLNFAEIKRLPADERKAKWEAYQALQPEEKRKLGRRRRGQAHRASCRGRRSRCRRRSCADVPAGRQDQAPRIAAGAAAVRHAAGARPAPAPPTSSFRRHDRRAAQAPAPSSRATDRLVPVP